MRAQSIRYAIIATFIWLGFVGAISFMEAWLKFRAPGIDLPLGLGIGRIVFNALNKMEWIFCLIIIFVITKAGWTPFKNKLRIPLFIAISILCIQSIWLLPALDQRAEQIIQGDAVQPSYLHLYYVLLEVLKSISLFIFGFQLLKIKNVL